MARTPYGNLTGRAASTELREQREWIEQDRREEERRKLREREQEVIERCVELEGIDNFSAWWDDDNNVPAFGKRRERIALVEARIAQLEHAQSVAPQ